MYADNITTPTPSIARVVEFVRQFRDRHGFSPSDADMARALRLERSWCSRIARQAVARGLLVSDPGISRSWRLPAAAVTATVTTTTSGSKPRTRRTR